MDGPLKLPRKKPDSDKRLIQYAFPEKLPIFWGPNQLILEDNKYVEPDGWKFNETLIIPWVVRFIHDSGTVNSDTADGTSGDPGGGGGPATEPWELYLVQSTLYLKYNDAYVGPHTSPFLPGICGLPNGSYTMFSDVYGYPNGDLTARSHVFISPLNSCENYLAGDYSGGTAGTFVGKQLKEAGWSIYFNWRQKSGPSSYNYFTTGACPNLWPASNLNSTNRTTPIYLQEFPWGVNPGAPSCPASGG